MIENKLLISQETEISREKKEILDSAASFAEFMASRWPQVEEDQTGLKLNYSFAGSLATELLPQADSFTEFELDSDCRLIAGQIRTISNKAKKIFSEFARPIGDFDFLPTDLYLEKQRAVQNLGSQKDLSEYQRRRQELLWKGGGGPSFEEIPSESKICLRRDNNQEKLMCDPVVSYSKPKTAKIRIGESDYFIASLDTMIAYKILQLLQKNGKETEKFNLDFEKILPALKEIYSTAELVAATKEAIYGYEATMKKSHDLYEADKTYQSKIEPALKKSLDNNDLSENVKNFLKMLL